MQEVQIESKPDGRKWLCVCKRWLARDEEDKKIERELTAAELTTTGATITPNYQYHYADEIIEHALPDYHKPSTIWNQQSSGQQQDYHDYNFNTNLSGNVVSDSHIQEQIMNASGTPLPIKETATCTVRINGQDITGIWVNKDECMNWRGPIPIERYRINTDGDITVMKKVGI